MEYAGRDEGAEIATVWLVTGQPADRPKWRLEENEREVRRGDQVLAGTYVTYRGYWAHCLRMGSLGEPPKSYRGLYDAAFEQHRQAAALIQVGRDAATIQTHADELARSLLRDGDKHPALGRQGHLLGIDYADKPTAAAFPQPASYSQFPFPTPAGVILRPRMVLELHTQIGQEGSSFGMLGDNYVTTESGPERLTQFPQDLFVV